MAKPTKYNSVTVVLHWVLGFMVPMMLFMGSVLLVNIPNDDPGKIAALKGHITFGLVVMGLTIFRMVWGRGTKRPDHLTTGIKALDTFGQFAHYGLNVLVLLCAFTGISLLVQAGLHESVFLGDGKLPRDFWAFRPREGHALFTKLLIALLAAHLMGAVYHQFILKDSVFKRIWFGKGEERAPLPAEPVDDETETNKD